MRGLDALRAALEPAADPDPTVQLADVAKSFVAKRRTLALDEVALAELNVDHYGYQRPPDRDKIKSMVAHLKAGGALKPIKVNLRDDGTLWVVDGQHRAAAAAICGRKTIRATITDAPQQEEQEDCEILAKITERQDGLVVDALRGAGAREDGKRLVLTLGPGRRVEYVPHSEWVGKTERGQLEIEAPNAREVAARLNLLPHDG